MLPLREVNRLLIEADAAMRRDEFSSSSRLRVFMRILLLASTILLISCTGKSDPEAATENDWRAAPAGKSPPGASASAVELSRSDVIQARRKFKVDVLSFDASQRFGIEMPYADFVRLRITNNSDIVLPCLTIMTKRYAQGEMVGSSRAPSISTRDINPGESVEYDYYPKGHLDLVKVDRITAEVEGIVDPEVEQFICELQGTT